MNSEDVKKQIKNKSKTMGKNISKSIVKKITSNPIFIGVLIFLIIILILSSGFYAIKEEEFKSAKSASSEYVENTKANPNDGVKTTYIDEETGQAVEYSDEKLRELFEKYGYNIEQYFEGEDGIKNLKYILNAEVVSQFPYIAGLDEDKVNGVVKFKRISSEGNGESLEEQYLIYTSQENFNNLIASNDIQNALLYFTMDDDKNIIVACVEKIEVVTNDFDKTIDEIRPYGYENIEYSTVTNENTGETTYTFEKLYTESVNYTDIIKDYVMPKELLFALLTYTQDLEFVLDIAKLAYESTVVIGIYDNAYSTDVREYYYNKQFKTEQNYEAGITSIYSLSDAFSDDETLYVTRNGQEYIVSRSDALEEIFFDENGNDAIFYTNYYTYQNTPVVDLYIADVWYGYYSKTYSTSEITSDSTENNLENTPYEEVYSNSIDSDAYKEEISSKLASYLESDEYKKSFEENFKAYFFADQSASQEELQEAYNEYYKTNFENALTNNIQACKDSIHASAIEILSICDANIIEKAYNIIVSTNIETSISAENNYFSKLLYNSSNAYDILPSSGKWMIEQLEKDEKTVGIVDKVKYLLNNAYNTTDFGEITAEDIGLYTTNSADIDFSTSSSFTEMAKACHEYLRLNNYYYSSAANKAAGNYVQDRTSTGGQVQIVQGAPQSERYTDCSAYVTWILIQTGHLPSTTTSQWNSTMLYNKGDELDGITSKTFSDNNTMKSFFENDVNTSTAGYILVKKGHTEIYAGKIDGYYCTYNAGSTSSIRKEISKYTEEQFFNHFASSEYKVLIVK